VFTTREIVIWRTHSTLEGMRTAYQEQLHSLNAVLGEMCDLAGSAMDRATQALLQADLAIAEEVLSENDRLSELSARAEEQAFALLALQAPVAGDLRGVVSGFQIVADVDRMGALALHVAEEVNGYFAEMGRLAGALAANAREVVDTQDPEAAVRLQEDDDAMDDLHRHLFTVLMDRDWEYGVAAAVDVTLLGRYYERFADHAVLIGRRVVFQATGQTPEQFQDAS